MQKPSMKKEIEHNRNMAKISSELYEVIEEEVYNDEDSKSNDMCSRKDSNQSANNLVWPFLNLKH